VQLDTNSSFSRPLYDTITNDINTNRIIIDTLTYDQSYHVRFRQFNKADTTPWIVVPFSTEGYEGRIMFTSGNNHPDVVPSTPSVDYWEFAEIQIDKNINFNSNNFQTKTVSYADQQRTFAADTFYQLDYGETYYARSRPINSRDTGVFSRVRTFDVHPYPTQYQPFLNATDVSVNALLRWDAGYRGTTHYRIQLDTTDEFNSPLLLDSTLQSGNEIQVYDLLYNQTYYRRTIMWHTKDTSDWSPVRSFVTEGKVSLQSPSNNTFIPRAVNEPLKWNPLSSVKNYQIRIDTSSDFNSAIYMDTVIKDTGAFNTKELLFEAIYYWSVRAISEVDTSEWSDIWTFRTAGPPRLDRPSNGAENIGIGPFLDWSSIGGTTGYILQYGTDSSFSGIPEGIYQKENAFFHWVTGDSSDFSTKYFWRIKLFHEKDTSSWSETWKFTTRDRNAPVHTSPADGSVNRPLNVQVRWEQCSGADAYRLELSEDIDFNNLQSFNVSSNARTLSLELNKTYYWRVTARDDGKDISDASAPWSFTTIETLPMVNLTSPADEATDQPVDITLRWSNVGTTRYEINLSEQEDFSFFTSKNTQQTLINWDPLSYSKTYYWRVRASSGAERGPWSDVFSFTTEDDISGIEGCTNKEIEIFPNPANGQLIVTLNSKKVIHTNAISFDGKTKPLKFERTQNGLIISLEYLEPGIYILQVITDEDILNATFIKE